MKLYVDTIQFDDRKEIRELIEIAEKYIKQNPDEDNKSLKRFVECLEVMDLAW